MRLSRADRATLSAILEADGATFTELVRIARLDPATAFRGADLAGIDFEACDLSGYDFSGADLTGSSFEHASIEETVFHRAETSDVAWPRGYKPRAKTASARPSPLLRPHQEAVVAAIVKTLSAKKAKPALTLLPPGVGQTAIIIEAIRRMRDQGDLTRAIILTETNAFRDQTIDRFLAAGFRATEFPKHPEQRLRLVDEIWVGTFARLRSTINGEISHDVDLMFKDISHAMLIGMPGLLPHTLKALEKFGITRVMVFGDITVRRTGIENPAMAIDVFDIFPGFAYVYEIEAALADGVLGLSEVIQRNLFVVDDNPMLHDEIGPAAASKLRLIAQDFAEEMLRRDSPTPAVLLARRVSDVEALTDYLQTCLDGGHEGGKSPVTAVPFSSHHRNDPPLNRLMDDNGVVVVTTPGHVERSSLRPGSLVGLTMSKVPDRLAVRLKYPPAASASIRVIDYGGGLSKAARSMDAL